MDTARATFSGHESFPFRSTWLTKGVTQCSRDPLVFTRDDAMVILGVGKNMVRSIRHWCLAARLLQDDPSLKNNRGRRLRPTDIGSHLLGPANWDPYLEDTGSLWLIHWLLATNADKATTCYYAFNKLHEPDFTRASLESAIEAMVRKRTGLHVSEQTLKRDVDVFIRSYIGSSATSGRLLEDSLDCPLAELRLMFEVEPRKVYSFSRGAKESLPDAVFLFALWEYAQGARGIRTLSFDDLAYQAGSPGAVFKLDEAALAERLDRLAAFTSNAWRFSETAGLKQVLMLGDVNAIDVLDQYYRRQRGHAVEAAL